MLGNRTWGRRMVGEDETTKPRSYGGHPKFVMFVCGKDGNKQKEAGDGALKNVSLQKIFFGPSQNFTCPNRGVATVPAHLLQMKKNYFLFLKKKETFSKCSFSFFFRGC